MAIFHLSIKIIGRGGGRNAVSAAAYRAAEKLYDERNDRTYDHTNKRDVVWSGILLPDGAPARLADRAELWNTVEAGERRHDAQLARECEISIPRELSRPDAIQLAQDFARETFVAKGMVADVCIHWGRESASHQNEYLSKTDLLGQDIFYGRVTFGEALDELMQREIAVLPDGADLDAVETRVMDALTTAAERADFANSVAQPHCHIMLSMRTIGPEGFGLKDRSWNDRALVGEWRERWASIANERLEALGHEARIDHRSLEAQGIDREPTIKIGAASLRMAEQGKPSDRVQEHRDIVSRNAMYADLTNAGVALVVGAGETVRSVLMGIQAATRAAMNGMKRDTDREPDRVDTGRRV